MFFELDSGWWENKLSRKFFEANYILKWTVWCTTPPSPPGAGGKKERKGKKQKSCFSELREFLLLLHLWTLYKAMSTVGFLQPIFEWELAWHLGLYFWRNFKASDFQFLITRVFIFSQSIIIHGSTVSFYGSRAKWESGWISNLILHLSKLDGSYLLQRLKASVRTSPHRVGKIEHMAIVKDKTLLVIRTKGTAKANEGRDHTTQTSTEHPAPSAQTRVMFVATGAMERGRLCRRYFPRSLLRKENLTRQQPAPLSGNEQELAFHWGLIQQPGVHETKNKNRGCSPTNSPGLPLPSSRGFGIQWFGCDCWFFSLCFGGSYWNSQEIAATRLVSKKVSYLPQSHQLFVKELYITP